MSKKIVVAITGASGSIYAKRLIDKLKDLKKEISDLEIVITDAGKQVWEYELKEKPNFKFGNLIENDNFFSPIASGSANYDTMIIIPCSMGTLGRIANGISDDLISRAADVILKERKKLILITRESPLSLIHINNMKKITEAGGTIIPASPSFYNNPKSINDLVDTVVFRALDHLGFNVDYKRWGE